jgi:hypothetical protein
MPTEYRFDDLDLREEPLRSGLQRGDIVTGSGEPQCSENGKCYSAEYSNCITACATHCI